MNRQASGFEWSIEEKQVSGSEQQSLIMDSLEENQTKNDEEEPPPSRWQKYFPEGYWHEFRQVMKLAVPLIVVQLCQILLGPLALVYSGQLGKIELDAVSLAVSLINVTCISIANGMATACDTVFAQVYGGSNRLYMGVCVQRALMIFALMAIPIWAFHINAEQFLLLINQDPEVARLAGEYLIIFIPGTLSALLYMVFSKYLQTQDIVIPNVIIGVIANFWNAGLHYFLMYYYKFGTNGSAIAFASSYGLMLLLIILYVIFSKIRVGTWEGGFCWEALTNWGSFCRIALYGLLMICLEWWSFEIGMFVTGSMGVTELAAQSVSFQYETISFMIPFGFSIAVAIRSGQFLGGGKPSYARASGLVGLSSILVISAVVATLIFIFKDYMPLLFTNDEEAVKLAADVLTIVAFFAFFDGLGAVGGGILRACGMQWVGTIVVGAIFMIALVVSIPLMLTQGDIEYFWMMLLIGMITENIIYGIILSQINWLKQSKMAIARGTEGKAISKAAVCSGTYSNFSSHNTEREGLLPDQDTPGREMLPRRLALTGALLAILAICIVIRVTVPPEHFEGEVTLAPNVTADYL